MTVVCLNERDQGSWPPGENPLFSRIALELEQRGLVVLPDALPAEIAQALVQRLSTLDSEGFHHASVGRGRTQTINQFIRRDSIHWIEDDEAELQAWHQWTEQLRVYLNRRLFLGLFSFESHFAVYQPGDFYKRHYDAFKGEANRVLSLVTYLNKGWEPDHGGELVIADEHNEEIRVSPGFGTLILFLSEAFPHEVLPATRNGTASQAGTG
jgi:SM-20-related protein